MTKKLFLDLVERAVWTFLQAGLGVFVLADSFDANLDNAEKAAMAGLAAVLALVKGVVASRVGDTGTAATLPATADPAANV